MLSCFSKQLKQIDFEQQGSVTSHTFSFVSYPTLGVSPSFNEQIAQFCILKLYFFFKLLNIKMVDITKGKLAGIYVVKFTNKFLVKFTGGFFCKS